MRWILIAVTLAPSVAAAEPSWSDTEAMIESATAPVDPALIACRKTTKTPWRIALIITRDKKTGDSNVNMPFPNVGIRGFTPEELCLMKTVALISVPRLPDTVDEITIVHTVDIKATRPTLGEWSDLPEALSALPAVASCSKKARTVRINLDVRHGKTRAWLPDWQFHSPSGDGSTPASEKPIQRCLTRALSTWKLAVLPTDLNEVRLAVK